MSNTKFYTLIACLLVTSLLTVGVQVGAFDGARNYVIENYYEASVPVVDDEISGVTFEDEYFQADIKSGGNTIVNQYGEWVGDDGNMVFGEVRLDFVKGTSSVTRLVSDIPGLDSDGDQSDFIHVYDAYYVSTGRPTTTPSIYMGTSSVSWITKTTSCGGDSGSTDVTCAAVTAGMASVLMTGAMPARNATGTTFFKQDFQGTDTRDGSGTRFVVPIREDSYLSMFASSTDVHELSDGFWDIEGDSPANFFAGYGVFKYFYEQGN